MFNKLLINIFLAIKQIVLYCISLLQVVVMYIIHQNNLKNPLYWQNKKQTI